MKKLISSTGFALLAPILALLMLIKPNRASSILFFLAGACILYGALSDLYFILHVRGLSSGMKKKGIIKDMISLVSSLIVICLSLSNPGSFADIHNLQHP